MVLMTILMKKKASKKTTKPKVKPYILYLEDDDKELLAIEFSTLAEAKKIYKIDRLFTLWEETGDVNILNLIKEKYGKKK